MDPPLYASPALCKYVEQRIVFPWRHPERYHQVTGTFPWMHALYGREGTNKARLLRELLTQQHEIHSVEVVSVGLGKCRLALERMICVRAALCASETTTTGPQYIIILDHADILCYEPDNENTMLDAIDIAQHFGANCGIMVIALFDRIPGEMAVDRASSFMRSCHNKFFAQFAANVCFVAAPTEDFRERLFRWAIGVFTTHMQTAAGEARPFCCEISDENYKELSMMSTYTTPAQILDWLNKSFCEIIQNPAQPVLDMPFLTRFNNIHQTPRGPHILNDDLQAIESRFSEACGCGPVGGHYAAAAAAAAAAPPTMVDTKITTFSEEYADTAVAKKALRLSKRQATLTNNKKKRGGSKKRIHDVDEFAG
jgi:hypothetical protein